MLYLDYSRKTGEWNPNATAARRTSRRPQFLRAFNELVYGDVPRALTIAEESTSWPRISAPV